MVDGAGAGGGVQDEIVVPDARTPAQRRHDALVEITRLAAGNLDAGVRAGEPPRVVVHTTPDQLTTTRTPTASTGEHGTVTGRRSASHPVSRPGPRPASRPVR